MTTYKTLTEMGIANPQQIARYSLQTVDQTDVLRVVYKRTKGSLLPTSKKFKFPREQKTVITDSANNSTRMVDEISPFLLQATRELKSFVNAKHSHQEHKAILADEILRLEEEMASRIAYIKTLVQRLD